MKTDILGVSVDCLQNNELEKILANAFSDDKKRKIAKVNTEFILRAYRNHEFKDALEHSDLKIADGSGVLWAARFLLIPLKTSFIRYVQASWQMIYTLLSLIFKPDYYKEPIPERFPGVEALKLMLTVAERENAAVYFFGSEEKVLTRAIPALMIEFPKLIVAGSSSGYGYKDDRVVKDINNKKPKLLIVALGSPKQEYWIRDNLDKLTSVKVAVGEGGSLDFLAGEQDRAPEGMRKMGLEWLWRLFANKDKTGKSRTKRVWDAVPVFIWTVFVYKIKESRK